MNSGRKVHLDGRFPLFLYSSRWQRPQLCLPPRQQTSTSVRSLTDGLSSPCRWTGNRARPGFPRSPDRLPLPHTVPVPAPLPEWSPPPSSAASGLCISLYLSSFSAFLSVLRARESCILTAVGSIFNSLAISSKVRPPYSFSFSMYCWVAVNSDCIFRSISA